MPKVEVLSKEEVLEKLTNSGPTRDYVIELGSGGTRLVEEEGLRIQHGKHTYALTDTAMQSLLRSVNLPPSLYSKISDYPDLTAYIINYFAERKTIVKKMFTRSRTALAFAAPETTAIPNAEIIDVLDKNIKEVRFDQLYEYPVGVMNIHCFTGNGTKFEVAQGDYFKYGVKVTNSPIGLVRPSVSAYAVRLTCTNGSVEVDDIWRAPGVYEPNWLASSIKSARKVSIAFFEKIKALTGVKLDQEHVDAVLESIYEDLEVPMKVRDAISRRVVKHGAATMYDIFNHVTYVGSHYEIARENPRLISRLMSIGGAIASHSTTCPNCYHLIKAAS